MKDLLNEIEQGLKEYEKCKHGWGVHGKGSKSYVTKRIDLLREKLLDIKKSLK